MKTCTHCKQEKPATKEFFPSNKQARDGLASWCRSCSVHSTAMCHAFVKDAALSHYCDGQDPYCKCCGEWRIEFLTIDHVAVDGAEHRRQIGSSSSSLYYWLRRNGYPDGYRALCLNCNAARGWFGVCPHETERQQVRIA